jgi:hypothetical protein
VVGQLVRRAALAVLLLVVLSGASYWLLRTVPTGFAPTEDQGYLLVNVQLPDAASLERTDAVVRQIEKIVLETPGVETVVAIGGRSFISGVNGPNVASLFPRLAPWSTRKKPDLQAAAILGRLRQRLARIQEAVVVVFPPPPIRGISSGGGFQFELQSVAGASLADLDVAARQIMEAARARPELATTFTGFRPGVPQLDAQVDRPKAKALGVPLSDLFATLQIFLGSLYVNDFNAFGRVYRVQLQAESGYRATPEDIGKLYVRSRPADTSQPPQMVPLSTLVTVRPITGPDTISHYNLYRSAEIAGDTAQGVSSGQAIAVMQDLARRHLPASMGYEWTGLAFQELEAGWARPDGVRAGRAVRLPRASPRSTRAGSCPSPSFSRAAGRPRRADRALARRDRQRRLRADRSRAPHRPREQERDPHRGVRKGASRAGARDPRGRPRGGADSLPADPDDVVRLHPGLAAPGVRVRSRRGRPQLDRNHRRRRDAGRHRPRRAAGPRVLCRVERLAEWRRAP